MKYHIKLLLVAFVVISNLPQTLRANNNPVYEARRNAYIDTALAHFGSDAITLQAYRGVPLDPTALNSLVAGIPTNGTVDFDLDKLVRILFLTNHAYDTLILPPLFHIPFWLTKSDTIRNYWSENHMIQWMSADWLLHESFGKPADANLDSRLRHYLKLKIQYGYYEFFSSVYNPYALAALLNLADFAQDAEIKSLATQASQRLLRSLLMLTNDKGVYYPTAGRNYYGKYLTPYGQNHNNLIYLLTGMGQAPRGASHAGGCLASSTLPVDSIILSWTPIIDTLLHNGHSLDSGFVINSGLAPLDKTIFQWSSGAYFAPQVALESGQLIVDSNLWHHPDFAPFRQLSSFPPSAFPSLSQSLIVASESSIIAGEDIAIFKHNSISLSSIQNFWKGKVGYQQFACVANVGNTPVLTAAGPIDSIWDDRNAENASQHLPYVSQNKNVALIMYRPESVPQLLPFHNPEVALYFKDSDYDEVRNDSSWLLGRQANNYVAVRRSCNDMINGVRGCYYNTTGQTWVIIVGDSSMYNSFDNFQSLIDHSQFEEKRYIDSAAWPMQSVYYAKIVFDNTTIAYAWDSTLDTTVNSIRQLRNNTLQFSVYPNPARNEVNLDLSPFVNQPVTVKVENMMGQQMYSDKSNNFSGNNKTINTAAWPEGVYAITVENGQNFSSQKLVKKE